MKDTLKNLVSMLAELISPFFFRDPNVKKYPKNSEYKVRCGYLKLFGFKEFWGLIGRLQR